MPDAVAGAKKCGPAEQGQLHGTAKKGITRYATNDRSMLWIAQAYDAAVTIECRRGEDYFAGVTRKMRPAPLSVSR